MTYCNLTASQCHAGPRYEAPACLEIGTPKVTYAEYYPDDSTPEDWRDIEERHIR